MNRILKGNFLKKMLILWFAAVLMISSLALTANADADDVRALETAIIDEGFEGGIIPPGWEVEYENPSYTWRIATDEVHSGTYSAKVPTRGSVTQDEWLISPLIDLTTTGLESATFSFWCRAQQNTEYTVKLYIDKAGDGFQDPDDVVWDMDEESTDEWGEYAWHQKTFDLTSYLGFTVKIAWRLVETSSTAGRLFHLDDILLTVPIVTPKTTLGIDTIVYGSGVGAVIENTGDYTAEDIDWTISVTGGIRGGIDTYTEGTIDKLKWHTHIDHATSVSSGSIFGFGRIQIEITVHSDDANPKKVTRTASGFVIFNRCYPMLGILSDQPWL